MIAQRSAMASAFFGKRRNIFIAIATVFVLVVILYSQPIVDTGRFRHIIPHHGTSADAAEDNGESGADANSNSTADAGSESTSDASEIDSVLQFDQGTPAEPKIPSGSSSSSESSGDDSKSSGDTDIVMSKPPAKTGSGWFGDSSEKVSQLHYIVPASDPNVELCYNLVSAAVNRYPVPLLVGYNATGELDASVTHLAKMRVIQTYLESLPASEDDDLVAIFDGYDIILQLPPLVLIERYYEIRDAADARLAKRFGINVAEARSRGLRQTLIWGPDKICWPIEWDEPRCWAVPRSNLPTDAFGPNTGNGDMLLADPRWLNSGTVMGPAKDLRKLIKSTMDEINATYDPNFSNSESDQYYIANLWGRQEYFRSLLAVHGGTVPGSEGKKIPEKRTEDEDTELHIFVDYESSLFQTKAGYEPWFGDLQFNQPGFQANMNVDMFKQGDDFEPYDIQMPANVVSGLTTLYDSVPEAHPNTTAQDWLANVNLGVNYVTKHIYGLWHCTGPKEWIEVEYPKLWFYPFAKALMKSSVKASQDGEPISSQLIDGRKWVAKTVYPDASKLKDELGGAWSDYDGGRWVNFKDMCEDHYDTLFGGEEGYVPSQ